MPQIAIAMFPSTSSRAACLLLVLASFTLNVHADDAAALADASAKVTDVKETPAVQATEAEKGQAPNGLITSNWSDFFNITRLQARTTADGRRSYTQATFVRFPSKIYIAQVYEFTEKYANDPRINYLEVNVGGPASPDEYIGKLFGWVCREQHGTGMSDVVSCGLQYNISDHNEFAEFRKKHKLTSFIQYFPIKNNDVLGKQDIVHYYSFSIYKSFYVRGYNNWYHYSNGQKDYLRALQDFILPVNKSFDAFVRHTYQNRDDIQYGKKGSEFSAGVRFNISF